MEGQKPDEPGRMAYPKGSVDLAGLIKYDLPGCRKAVTI